MIFDRKDRCYRGGKRHAFEPRYQEKPLRVEPKDGTNLVVMWQVMNPESREHVYLGDVCVWCGATITALVKP